ncbi:MAG: hypothetical protein M3Z14_06440 [Candidatus Eremiobacteraeota bacterium]|nr:hypothetical protein [Candidatus Eremiobacteraeota bacterium]
MLCVVVLSGTIGCAAPIEHWIVDTRNHQGDVALERGSLSEAQLAYRLSLRVDPSDAHARSGYSAVALEIADRNYRAARFEDALDALTTAAKYDPASVRVQALRSQIEQAKLKREIVSSNYPLYKETGVQMQRSYQGLKAINARIIRMLQRFNYNYDTGELSRAIQESYQLNSEVVKNTNRLITFRQLVESGVPESVKDRSSGALAPSTSLLPLP